jgi:hypothetical protein
VFFRENHQGIVDEVDRRIEYTGKQLLSKFPKLSDDIKSKIQSNPDKKWCVIHSTRPRSDLDPTRLDYRGMPYMSVYVLKDEKFVLEEGGYTSFPYSISRYKQAPGEVYGRSPAMDALPSIKTLNEQKKTVLKQGHRAVDPVLLMHDDGILDGFSMKPGAGNPGGVTADGKPLVHALPVGNVMIGKDLMDDERMIIKDAFLSTMFQILTENPQQTATEVMERVKERSILLTPVLGRQQTESLEPMITRELDILAKQKVLDPMPEILREARGEYQIRYSSPLNLEQRSKEAAGFMRSLSTALEVVKMTGNAAPLDHFNFDAAIPAITQIQGAPVDWMNSIEQVQQIRQGRAEDQQKEQMIQAAPAAAAMIKADAAANQAG